MSETTEKYSVRKPFGLIEILFFGGLGLSTYGVYALAGDWAWVWSGAWLLLASYRAPG